MARDRRCWGGENAVKRLIAACLLLLSGCAGQQSGPPGIPSFDAIGATAAALQAYAAPGAPTAMLNIGTVLDDQGCYGWFDQQVLAGQKSTFLQSLLGLGGGGAAIAGGPAGLAAAGAMGLASGALGAAQTNSPTGTDPVAAYALTSRQRQTWLAAVAATPPLTPDVAWVYLNAYHQYCTLSGIRLAVAQAAMTSPVTVYRPPMAPIPVSVPPSPPPALPPPSLPPQPQPLPQPSPPSPQPPIHPPIVPPQPVTPNFRAQSLIAVPPQLCINCR
jgi:hypothetical protein